jgi:TolB-like protein
MERWQMTRPSAYRPSARHFVVGLLTTSLVGILPVPEAFAQPRPDPTVAVIPFECTASVEDASAMVDRATSVAEWTIHQHYPAIRLVERQHIRAVMRELAFAAQGGAKNGAELGRLLGAQYLVLGEIQSHQLTAIRHVSEQLLIARSAVALKVVDVATSEVAILSRGAGYRALHVATGGITDSPALLVALDRAVRVAVTQLGGRVALFPQVPAAMRLLANDGTDGLADRREEAKFLSAQQADADQQLWSGLMWGAFWATLAFGTGAVVAPWLAYHNDRVF